MDKIPLARGESIVVLYKGGRLPSWHDLADAKRRDFEQRHVNLMLSVAQKYGLRRIEGFRLFAPEPPWERFWLIEFPVLDGAEAWIEAEVAPPYGRYGYYEYYLSRRYGARYYNDWVETPAAAAIPRATDPHDIPKLEVGTESLIVVLFDWIGSNDDEDSGPSDSDAEHIANMQRIACEFGLTRLDVFRLVAPQADWNRAWIAEFPTLDGAEAWMEAETRAHGDGQRRIKTMHVARKWAPEYFASWVP
jgi:hypothetical protein